MTPTEIIMVASSPVIAGAGAALYKGLQEWRKRRDERLDREREQEHEEELARIEAERQARIAEATADATGRHELEGYRGQARTLERLWDRVERIEEREEKCREEIAESREEIAELRERDDARASELEQCHRDRDAAKRDRDELKARIEIIENVGVVRRAISASKGIPAQTGDTEIEEK